jgi:putative endonuclease
MMLQKRSDAQSVKRYNHRVHYVYIVECVDGTLYTGYAIDVDRRIAAHNAGRGAKYTAGRRPVALVYSESFETKSDALKRECELKRRPRKMKEVLFQTDVSGGKKAPPAEGTGMMLRRRVPRKRGTSIKSKRGASRSA